MKKIIRNPEAVKELKFKGTSFHWYSADGKILVLARDAALFLKGVPEGYFERLTDEQLAKQQEFILAQWAERGIRDPKALWGDIGSRYDAKSPAQKENYAALHTWCKQVSNAERIPTEQGVSLTLDALNTLTKKSVLPVQEQEEFLTWVNDIVVPEMKRVAQKGSECVMGFSRAQKYFFHYSWEDKRCKGIGVSVAFRDGSPWFKLTTNAGTVAYIFPDVYQAKKKLPEQELFSMPQDIAGKVGFPRRECTLVSKEGLLQLLQEDERDGRDEVSEWIRKTFAVSTMKRKRIFRLAVHRTSS